MSRRLAAALPGAAIDIEAIAAYERAIQPGIAHDTFHDIGTSRKDLGRGRQRKGEVLMQYAFKTPMLRSVALRPPFMHDGSVIDLCRVVKHYEKGGTDRPSRPPLIKPIELSDQERRDLSHSWRP